MILRIVEAGDYPTIVAQNIYKELKEWLRINDKPEMNEGVRNVLYVTETGSTITENLKHSLGNLYYRCVLPNITRLHVKVLPLDIESPLPMLNSESNTPVNFMCIQKEKHTSDTSIRRIFNELEKPERYTKTKQGTPCTALTDHFHSEWDKNIREPVEDSIQCLNGSIRISLYSPYLLAKTDAEFSYKSDHTNSNYLPGSPEDNTIFYAVVIYFDDAYELVELISALDASGAKFVALIVDIRSSPVPLAELDYILTSNYFVKLQTFYDRAYSGFLYQDGRSVILGELTLEGNTCNGKLIEIDGINREMQMGVSHTSLRSLLPDPKSYKVYTEKVIDQENEMWYDLQSMNYTLAEFGG